MQSSSHERMNFIPTFNLSREWTLSNVSADIGESSLLRSFMLSVNEDAQRPPSSFYSISSYQPDRSENPQRPASNFYSISSFQPDLSSSISTVDNLGSLAALGSLSAIMSVSAPNVLDRHSGGVGAHATSSKIEPAAKKRTGAVDWNSMFISALGNQSAPTKSEPMTRPSPRATDWNSMFVNALSTSQATAQGQTEPIRTTNSSKKLTRKPRKVIPKDKAYVGQVTDNDVLFGRGGRSNHVSNRLLTCKTKFRPKSTISQRKDHMFACSIRAIRCIEPLSRRTSQFIKSARIKRRKLLLRKG